MDSPAYDMSPILRTAVGDGDSASEVRRWYSVVVLHPRKVASLPSEA